MAKRIIVLGTMRSGTSLTAELIRLWGAYGGAEGSLWKSDVNDPRGYGYMEYIPLQNLNDKLLDNNDRLPPFNQVLEKKTVDPILREKALKLIHDMDEQAEKNNFDTWIWKDARLPLTLPFWTRIWDDPIYVITIRHPVEIVLSSARTEEMSEESIPFSAGLAYWQYCMLNILSYTQQSRHKIFFAYEQLLNNPVEECTRLCHFLDEHCGVTPEGADGRIQAMVPQVARNQRHHHSPKALAEMEQATREQRALYDFLRVKTLYPNEAFQPDDFALYPGWREYLEVIDMLMSFNSL